MMILKIVLFMLLASPASFKATRGLLGNWIAGSEGLATVPGLLLHAIVFSGLLTLIWRRVSGFHSQTRGGEIDAQDEALQARNFLD